MQQVFVCFHACSLLFRTYERVHLCRVIVQCCARLLIVVRWLPSVFFVVINAVGVSVLRCSMFHAVAQYLMRPVSVIALLWPRLLFIVQRCLLWPWAISGDSASCY